MTSGDYEYDDINRDVQTINDRKDAIRDKCEAIAKDGGTPPVLKRDPMSERYYLVRPTNAEGEVMRMPECFYFWGCG